MMHRSSPRTWLLTLLTLVTVSISLLPSSYPSTVMTAAVITPLHHTPSASALVAYNIDLEMDKAREEKTVEHYGEPIRGLVQQANQNNEKNPERKPTAESTYERQNPLIEALPERVGKDFSKEDLDDMEKNWNHGKRNQESSAR